MILQKLSISRIEEHTDCTLISLWQQGNTIAFEALYKRYVGELVTLINRKTGSLEIGRELAQEVFLTLFVQKENLHDIENFKAYLFGIAKNKILNHYRHELIKQKYKDYILNKNDLEVNHAKEVLENKQLLQLIHEQIEQLPPKCKEVFKLSRQENLSYKCIASQLHISENTVDQHIQKALRILRSIVEKYQVPDGRYVITFIFSLATVYQIFF